MTTIRWLLLLWLRYARWRSSRTPDFRAWLAAQEAEAMAWEREQWARMKRIIEDESEGWQA